MSTLSLRSVIPLIAFAVFASAQSIVYPTTAAASATPLPSAFGYTYVGCWNETIDIENGTRALLQTTGKAEAYNNMTTSNCLAFCATGNKGASMQLAGLEYGRECYCSAYLSSFSTLLKASRCNVACNGNASEVCGGSLAISLYNLTSASPSGIAGALSSQSVTWYMGLAFLTLLAAGLM